MMPDWVVIADDLTGACDTGVSFARRGYSTRVSFDPGADFSGCDVRVLTTESRALPGAQAALAVQRAFPVLAGLDDLRIYKKIDSTLRGNPESELAALLGGLNIDRALVCPAFPEQGRVVRGGQVYVHGEPLGMTAFAAEVSDPDLLQMFSSVSGCQPLFLDRIRGNQDELVETLSQPGVFLADAETSADLRILARAGEKAGIRCFCGSAGLARGLVDLLPEVSNRNLYPWQPGPILIVAGSRAAATREQVDALREQGAGIVFPSLDDLHAGRDVEALVSRIANDMRKYGTVVISAAGLVPGDPWQTAAGLARLAAGVLGQIEIGGLMLTGGETAAAVCRAVGCLSIDLGGEVQPGVVWGQLGEGQYAGLPVVTKAGGFGDRNTLSEAVRFLQT